MPNSSNIFADIQLLAIPQRQTDEFVSVAPDMNLVVAKVNELIRALKQEPAVNVPPSVSVALNAVSVEVGNAVIATATPQDVDGQIVSVTFTQNGDTLGVVTQAPWRWVWTPALGNYTINAIALDDKGAATKSADKPLEVKNPTPAPQPTTYGATYDTTAADYTTKCGSGTGLSQTATVAGYPTQLLADAAAKRAAILKIVCTVSQAPIFRQTLTGPKEEDKVGTGTQLGASAGNLFKFNDKPLGDGTGKVMQLSLDGVNVLAQVDFLAPYLTRLDGGAGGELFSFQLSSTSTVYYGRFTDITTGIVTLSTSYNI